MDFQVGLMLGLLGATLVVFALELIPLEVTAVALLAVLILLGLVPVGQAFAGFGSRAVMAIGALFVLSHALAKAGLIERAAAGVGRVAERSRWLGIAVLLIGISLLSGFLNNTAVVAVFIPLATALCARIGMSPSKLLLPVSYAAICGGTLTLIGTSTNLIVSDLAVAAGQPPFGMFEFTKLGAVILVVGLAYILLLAPRLLPERVPPASLLRKYGLGEYFAELHIPAPASEKLNKPDVFSGKTLEELELGERFGVDVLTVVRGERRFTSDFGALQLLPGDALIVRAAVDDLLAMRDQLGVSLPSDRLKATDQSFAGEVLAEVLLTPQSRLVGLTLREADFRRRFGAFVIGIRRHSEALQVRVSRTLLRAWDSLLTLAPRERLEEMRGESDWIVLSEHEVEPARRPPRWWLVAIVSPAVVLVAALGWLEIAAAALIGVVVLVVAKVLTPREAYRSIDWSVIVLVAAFVPVGQAVVETGTAAFVSDLLMRLAGVVPVPAPYAVLSLLYLATSLLTLMVSNAAAAIVVTPIGLSLAASLGVDPRPFIIAVCFAASTDFATPMGYQTNMMVYAPGGYRFLDYTRVGGPLNLLFWATASVAIPWLWGL